MQIRIEKDLLGEKEIDDSSYFGINTKRALENFNLGGKTVNLNLIKEIALIKKAAAIVNEDLKELPKDKAEAIIKASEEVIDESLIASFTLVHFKGEPERLQI